MSIGSKKRPPAQLAKLEGHANCQNDRVDDRVNLPSFPIVSADLSPSATDHRVSLWDITPEGVSFDAFVTR
jgi:hypothetical protein